MGNNKFEAEAALHELAKVFWDAALREVEAKLDAEEKASEPPASDGTAGTESDDNRPSVMP
jgi:hypothetical protein